MGTSVLQTVVAQQTANKARERERAASDAARRFQDIVELRVSGVESADAVRPLPQNDSEQARDEHEAEDPESRKALMDAQRIDVTG